MAFSCSCFTPQYTLFLWIPPAPILEKKKASAKKAEAQKTNFLFVQHHLEDGGVQLRHTFVGKQAHAPDGFFHILAHNALFFGG